LWLGQAELVEQTIETGFVLQLFQRPEIGQRQANPGLFKLWGCS
jgi:hypothetical protein